MLDQCSFRLDHYESTLRAYRDAGYGIMSLSQYQESKWLCKLPDKILVLRHDIDIFPRAALPMVFREWALEVNSTLFVRLHSPFYNALSYENISNLVSIKGSGSELGLHAEPDVAALVHADDEQEFLEGDVRALESSLSISIQNVSSHSTRKGLSWGADVVQKMCDQNGLTYINHKYDGMKYLSDSNGRWREGCFCEWVNKESRLQVLTHPTWWFMRSPQENY